MYLLVRHVTILVSNVQLKILVMYAKPISIEISKHSHVKNAKTTVFSAPRLRIALNVPMGTM